MNRTFQSFAATTGLLFGLLGASAAVAQKPGGVLKIYHRDSPASMAILEEGTNSTEIPMMGVFNNLVMYDQHVAQNSLSSIVPDLATGWSRPIIYHFRAATCWQPRLQGLTIMSTANTMAGASKTSGSTNRCCPPFPNGAEMWEHVAGRAGPCCTTGIEWSGR